VHSQSLSQEGESGKFNSPTTDGFQHTFPLRFRRRISPFWVFWTVTVTSSPAHWFLVRKTTQELIPKQLTVTLSIRFVRQIPIFGWFQIIRQSPPINIPINFSDSLVIQIGGISIRILTHLRPFTIGR